MNAQNETPIDAASQKAIADFEKYIQQLIMPGATVLESMTPEQFRYWRQLFDGMIQAATERKDKGGCENDIESESIIGGSNKNGCVNFRNFSEYFGINVKDMAMALGMSEENLGEIWVCLLRSMSNIMN